VTAGSAVHRQMVLDNDDEEEDDDVASNHSTAAESISTVPEDNFMTSATAPTSAPSTPSSETALNLVCSPRSASSIPSTGNGNANPEISLEPEQGLSGSVAAGQVSGSSSVRGTSKRKSAVPTRCSTQQVQDDELMSDDNSSDVPASKRRNVEPITTTDTASTSTTEDKAAKAVEPNNNKVQEGTLKTEEHQETCGSEEQVEGRMESGKNEAVGLLVPRTSTPTASDLQPVQQGFGSPNACSHMSDDVSSIGSDEDHKGDKEAAGGHCVTQLDTSGDDVNDSGVVVELVGKRDDEASGGKTVPDSSENGVVSAAVDESGKGSSSQSGYVCLVEGCNATFPSKRSRDRHSANLNLHRKLLSTSGGKPTSAVFSEHPFPPPVVVSSATDTDEAGCLVLNLSRMDNHAPISGLETGTAAAADPTDSGPLAVDSDGEASRSSSVGPEEESMTGTDSTSVTCHVCTSPSVTFRDKLALKEHLETVHPRETHRCTVAGCDKLFSTRKSRNRHSQNDNLHRHLVVSAPRQ